MPDYYLKGEERFGYFTSMAYLAVTKIGSYKKFTKFIAKDIYNSEVKVILDIGTGPASIPIEISRFCKNNILIFAVDPSKQMVFLAKHRTKNYKNITIAIGSSRKIPFERKFDIILSSLSFHHWKEKEESLQYLKGFLKKGGEIRIYEYNKTSLSKLHAPISTHSVSKEELEYIGKSCKMKTKVKITGEFISARFIP